MRTFKDIHVGDVLVELFFDASNCNYSAEHWIVTKIKKNELETKNIETDVDDYVRINNWDDTIAHYSYYDSSDAQYIFSDIMSARNFLTTAKKLFIENIDKNLNEI